MCGAQSPRGLGQRIRTAKAAKCSHAWRATYIKQSYAHTSFVRSQTESPNVDLRATLQHLCERAQMSARCATIAPVRET